MCRTMYLLLRRPRPLGGPVEISARPRACMTQMAFSCTLSISLYPTLCRPRNIL